MGLGWVSHQAGYGWAIFCATVQDILAAVLPKQNEQEKKRLLEFVL